MPPSFMHEAGHSFAKMGIGVSPTLDLKKMLAFKQEAIDGNTKGIDFLFKKNKVTVFRGTGRITAPGKVEVTEGGNKQTIEAKNIVIATGSDVARLKGIEIDEKRIISSTGGLELSAVPGQLVVIGAGVIGLELGSVWARLGAKVTVIEYLDRILPGMDLEVAKNFQRLLQKQGFTFMLSSKVTAAKVQGEKVQLTVEPAAGGEAKSLEADIVLVAVGRTPFTEGLGLDEVGVKRDAKGRVEIGEHFETNVPGIYAIGDVVRRPDACA